MKSSDYYRGQAEKCEAEAQRLAAGSTRNALIEAAEMWRQLAYQAQLREAPPNTSNRRPPSN
jgi:hypothetical protein